MDRIEHDQMSVVRRLVQAWWAPIAFCLALGEIVAGIGIFVQGENWSGRIIGGLVVTAGFGVMALYGLWVRPTRRPIGNALIVIGVLPWCGMFWAIVPPLVVLVVWIGVFTSGFDPAPRARRATA